MINSKKTIKALISLILIVVLASSIWIGTGSAFIPGQSSVSPNANYITFEGTAANDSYSSQQYSYVINQWAIENGVYPPAYYLGTVGSGSIGLTPGNVYFNASKSLRIGMTEFGEFADQGNTGIAYGATAADFANTETWASNAINQAYMVQGWVFYMNYSRFYVPRAIEAYALYSNTNTPESARQVYSWDPTQANSVAVTITSGSLTPSGIQVLYDSARLGVARETTVIKDGFYNEAVAQVTVTVIFDKTTKYAIVYYDVKIVLDPKVLIQIYDFVFQKKYEIDLARNVNPSNAAFVHYYSNYSQSVYQNPLTGNYTYDVIQAYDPAHQYIFFDGIYPMATEYSVASPLVPTFISPTTPFGGTTQGTYTVSKLLPPATAIADIPPPISEPNTPVITIQWNYTQTAYPSLTDFLTKSPNREIRFTDVYGMTNYNLDPSFAVDLNDTSITATANRVDAEVQYLLKNDVFNPVDLTTVALNPALWVAVGSGSSATDSAGAAAMASLYMPWSTRAEPLGLFDANDSLPLHLGSIPYGLSPVNTTSYTYTFNNFAKGSGSDPTPYYAFGLINFAFGTYDGATTGTTPQPISGGLASKGLADGDDFYWYPAKDPLTERWIWDNAGSDAGWFYTTHEGLTALYDSVTWHPNGIITVGGEKANGITRYFNDFNFAIDREVTGTTAYYSSLVSGFPQTVSPLTPPSSIITGTTVDFFPLSTWNTSSWNPITQKSGYITTFGYGPGTAIIAIATDNNGTRGISVAGWNAEDTYWASAWAAQYLTVGNNGWIPAGAVAIILQMTYANANSEPTFNVARVLGTITEFGSNYFASFYGNFDRPSTPAMWSGNEALWTGTMYPSTYWAWWYAKLPTTSTALVQYDS